MAHRVDPVEFDHNYTPVALDDRDVLFDVWTNSVFAAVNSAHPEIMRIVRDGAIPFPCEAHGWFGVFPCRAYGVENRMRQ
eukprot:1761513-Pleurochrysis_carterae.AAC.1